MSGALNVYAGAVIQRPLISADIRRAALHAVLDLDVPTTLLTDRVSFRTMMRVCRIKPA
jgi:hypothetical protein